MKTVLLALFALNISCPGHTQATKITFLKPMDGLEDKPLACVYFAQTQELVCDDFMTIVKLLNTTEKYDYL